MSLDTTGIIVQGRDCYYVGVEQAAEGLSDPMRMVEFLRRAELLMTREQALEYIAKRSPEYETIEFQLEDIFW